MGRQGIFYDCENAVNGWRSYSSREIHVSKAHAHIKSLSCNQNKALLKRCETLWLFLYLKEVDRVWILPRMSFDVLLYRWRARRPQDIPKFGDITRYPSFFGISISCYWVLVQDMLAKAKMEKNTEEINFAEFGTWSGICGPTCLVSLSKLITATVPAP